MKPTLILVTLFGMGFLYYTTGLTGYYVLLGLLVIVLTLVYFNQNKLLYIPVVPDLPLSPSGNPVGYRSPREQNLSYRDVVLTTEDNVKIKGWHILGSNSKRIIVYFHENAGNIGTRIPYIRSMSQLTNSDVILVAYRGYSDSEGSPTQQGLKKDSESVLAYTLKYQKQENPDLPIYILGRSLGGAVTVHVSTKSAFKDAIKGIVLENTFTSIGDMIDSVFPPLRFFKFLQKNFWRSIDQIPLVTVPILFVKSMRDQLVPPAQMDRLIKNATAAPRVEVHQIPYGTHNSSWDQNPKEYFARLCEFFEKD